MLVLLGDEGAAVFPAAGYQQADVKMMLREGDVLRKVELSCAVDYRFQPLSDNTVRVLRQIATSRFLDTDCDPLGLFETPLGG